MDEYVPPKTYRNNKPTLEMFGLDEKTVSIVKVEYEEYEKKNNPNKLKWYEIIIGLNMVFGFPCVLIGFLVMIYEGKFINMQTSQE